MFFIQRLTVRIKLHSTPCKIVTPGYFRAASNHTADIVVTTDRTYIITVFYCFITISYYTSDIIVAADRTGTIATLYRGPISDYAADIAAAADRTGTIAIRYRRAISYYAADITAAADRTGTIAIRYRRAISDYAADIATAMDIRVKHSDVLYCSVAFSEQALTILFIVNVDSAYGMTVTVKNSVKPTNFSNRSPHIHGRYYTAVLIRLPPVLPISRII